MITTRLPASSAIGGEGAPKLEDLKGIVRANDSLLFLTVIGFKAWISFRKFADFRPGIEPEGPGPFNRSYIRTIRSPAVDNSLEFQLACEQNQVKGKWQNCILNGFTFCGSNELRNGHDNY